VSLKLSQPGLFGPLQLEDPAAGGSGSGHSRSPWRCSGNGAARRISGISEAAKNTRARTKAGQRRADHSNFHLPPLCVLSCRRPQGLGNKCGTTDEKVTNAK